MSKKIEKVQKINIAKKTKLHRIDKFVACWPNTERAKKELNYFDGILEIMRFMSFYFLLGISTFSSLFEEKRI